MVRLLSCADCAADLGEAKPGRSPLYCPPCRVIRKRKWARDTAQRMRERSPDAVRQSAEKWRKENPEKVKKLNQEYYAKNRESEKDRARAFREKHPEKVAKANAEWRKANPEKHKKLFDDWYQANKEVRASYRREQYEANKEYENAKSRAYKEAHRDELRQKQAEKLRLHPEINRAAVNKRRAAKMQAIPSWADLDKISAIYAEAVRLSRQTGTPYHVDHIVPLQSKWVCGLHVETNLQVLPASENFSKSNRRWPDALKDFIHQETK